MPEAAVELIDFTGRSSPDPWYAANLLIWAKQTRTEMSPGGLSEISSWDEGKKLEQLQYIAATIPASWEFVDFTFLITNVTRAFTHQFVRTRTLSFAQQTMQVLRVEGWDYHTGPSIKMDSSGAAEEIYDSLMRAISRTYTTLCNLSGVRIEDARGVLPTNILTNIVAKGNLRTWCDLLRKRASPRNQGQRPGYEGEWSLVHREIRRQMQLAMPWTSLFLDRTADVVARDLYQLLENVADDQLRTDLTKRVDQLMYNVGEEP